MNSRKLLLGSDVNLYQSVEEQVKLWEQCVNARIWQNHPLGGNIEPGFSKGFLFGLRLTFQFGSKNEFETSARGVLSAKVLCAGYGRIVLWVGFDYHIDRLEKSDNTREFRYPQLNRFGETCREIDWETHGFHDSCWQGWTPRVMNEFPKMYARVLPKDLHGKPEGIDRIRVHLDLSGSNHSFGKFVWVKHQKSHNADAPLGHRDILSVLNPRTKNEATPW